MQIIYIVWDTGAGKTTALRNLAGDNPIISLCDCSQELLQNLSDTVFIDDARPGNKDKLDILFANPNVTRVYIACEFIS